MSRFRWACLSLIVVSVGLAGTTCEQTGRRDAPTSSESSASDDHGSAQKDDRNGNGGEKTTSDSDGPLSNRGSSCRVDPQCSSYLRCLEGTCSIPPAVTGEHDTDTPRLHVYPADASPEDADPIASFYLELATTPAERRRGLMYRREMKSDWGMLFVYRRARIRSFWMKDTYIPLDMVFVGPRGRIVHIVHSADPLTLTSHRSKHPARYVLELKGGVTDSLGIEVGQTIRLEGVPQSIRPN